MKRMDLFCTSRASTAVCSSHGRRKPQVHVPCLSQLPINPNRKSSCSRDQSLRRRSSADVDDLRSPPPGSSARYLLADSPFIDLFSVPSPENFPALVPAAQPNEEKKTTLNSNGNRGPRSSSLSRSMTVHEYRGLKSPSQQSSKQQSPALRTSSSARSRDQVVVLKVSLHCKGCEEKVKKHLSKMEGVTSFSVDFTTKKVTIIGDVTPLAALASVSKVKHAQLWQSPSSSSNIPFSI